MTERRDKYLVGDPDGEAGTQVREYVHKVTGNEFIVADLNDAEATSWKEALLSRVAPEFLPIALAGLAAINATLQEVVGDKGKIAALYAIPLFTHPDEITINPSIDSDVIIPRDRMYEANMLKQQGECLIATATVATELQRVGSRQESTTDNGASGWKTRTYEKNRAGMQYELVKQDGAFGSATNEIRFSFPTSRAFEYGTVSVVRNTRAGGQQQVIGRFGSGVINNGRFVQPYSDGQSFQIELIARSIHKAIKSSTPAA